MEDSVRATRSGFWRGLGVALLLVALPGAAAGQEGEEGEGGWSGSADFGLTFTEGNSETTTVSAGVQAAREWRLHRLGLSGSVLRTTDEGEEVANRGNAALRYDYSPGERFFLFHKSEISYNTPADLDLRVSPTAGAGYTVARTGRVTLSVDGGGSWIRDEFTDGSSSSAFHFTAGENLELTISDNTDLVQEVRYSPKAEDLSDYLLHAEVALTTMISGAVGLRVKAIEDFDSTPFQGTAGGEEVEEHDFTLVTGVTVKF